MLHFKFAVILVVFATFGVLTSSSPLPSTETTTNVDTQSTTAASSEMPTTLSPETSCGGIEGFFHLCEVNDNSTTTSSPTSEKSVPESVERRSKRDIEATATSTEQDITTTQDSSEETADVLQKRDIGDMDPDQMSGIEGSKTKRQAVPDSGLKVRRDVEAKNSKREVSDMDQNPADAKMKRAADSTAPKAVPLPAPAPKPAARQRRGDDSSEEDVAEKTVNDDSTKAKRASDSTVMPKADTKIASTKAKRDVSDDGSYMPDADNSSESSRRRRDDSDDCSDSQDDDNSDYSTDSNDFSGSSIDSDSITKREVTQSEKKADGDSDESDEDSNSKIVRRETSDSKQETVRRSKRGFGGLSSFEIMKRTAVIFGN